MSDEYDATPIETEQVAVDKEKVIEFVDKFFDTTDYNTEMK